MRGHSGERRQAKRADYLLRYTRKATEVLTPEEPEANQPPERTFAEAEERAGERSRRKYYYDRGRVEVDTHLVYELDTDGKQLRVVKLTDYTAEKVRTLCASPDELRARWADAEQRADLLRQLTERGIDFHHVAAEAGKPDTDPFDLLCHLAFNAPILTRRQRADRVKQQQAAMFKYLLPEAREILNQLLEKYATDGEVQFILPDVLKLPPISNYGTVGEIMRAFCGPEQLRVAVKELQSLLYASQP